MCVCNQQLIGVILARDEIRINLIVKLFDSIPSFNLYYHERPYETRFAKRLNKCTLTDSRLIRIYLLFMPCRYRVQSDICAIRNITRSMSDFENLTIKQPIRRLEIQINNFNVAIPHHVDLLQRHRNNIRKVCTYFTTFIFINFI